MLRVTTIWTGNGGPYYTTIHFGGTTPGEAVVAANAVRTFWFQLANRLSVTVTANVSDDVELVDVATNQILAVFPAATAVVLGTDPNEVLPSYVQALVRLRTGTYVAGRELRGRIFVPGFAENDNVSGNPDATLVVAIADAFDAAFGALPASNAVTVYSPTHFQGAPISSRSVWDQWAVLRSRRS